jgi:hypothetical protein
MVGPATFEPDNSVECRLSAIGLSPGAFAVRMPKPFCAIVEPVAGTSRPHASDYLESRVLQRPAQREAFFDWIDGVGLVVLRGLDVAPETYRGVRGRSSKGRLSQGEYYHHDGCSGPTKPRVVEIRCPFQTVERRVHTAVAPFPASVRAMAACLPDRLRSDEIMRAIATVDDDATRAQWDVLQGVITRAVRKELTAEGARAFFRNVDEHCNAFVEPWQMGESRFIANANPRRTMQHRRAYQRPHVGGEPTGHLCKRWPWEELGFADLRVPAGAS